MSKINGPTSSFVRRKRWPPRIKQMKHRILKRKGFKIMVETLDWDIHKIEPAIATEHCSAQQVARRSEPFKGKHGEWKQMNGNK